MQSSRRIVLLHQLLQTFFIDRRDTRLHHFYLAFINIHTGDVVPLFCKAYACHQSYISGSRYCYFHAVLLLLSFLIYSFSLLNIFLILRTTFSQNVGP